jgi:hypothetical protein
MPLHPLQPNTHLILTKPAAAAAAAAAADADAAADKCLCSSGHFTPCSPTDTVCSWGDQPICVGSKTFFGIEACKFVGAMQQHLPKVQCPYKSLAKGLQYQQLG